MRQCHMNLTLATQQSDVTKNMQLREKMQRLNQQQAKLHFKMDELLSKERKLNLVKANTNTPYDPSLQYNLNDQAHATYGYGQGAPTNQVSLVSSNAPVLKGNPPPQPEQNSINYNINEQNSGSYAYLTNGPVPLNCSINGAVHGPIIAAPISGSSNESGNAYYNDSSELSSQTSHIKMGNTSPLEAKTILYNNTLEKSSGHFYIHGNPVSPIDKNSGQYFIQGNAVSPVSMIAKGHTEEQVRVVPLNNVDNVGYVNFESNMKVAV